MEEKWLIELISIHSRNPLPQDDRQYTSKIGSTTYRICDGNY